MPNSDSRPLTDSELDAKVSSAILEEIALNGRTYFSETVSVSLVDLAHAVEKRGLFVDISQQSVFKWLKQLHNLGRIRLEKVRLCQQGRSKKNVVAVADLIVLNAPYRKPKRTFSVREPESRPEYDLTKK